MKREKAYLILPVVLLLLFIGLLLSQPEGISWKPTFSKKDTSPFSSKAVFELLSGVFPQQEIKPVYVPAYELLNTSEIKENKNGSSNYLLVNQSADFNKFDTEAILNFADKGNHVFIAAESITGPLSDSIGLFTEFSYGEGSKLFTPSGENVLNFTDEQLKTDSGFKFRPNEADYYVFLTDSVEDVEILATNAAGLPVLVEKKWGNGFIYFSSVPLAFTNYYLLPLNNHGFISRCMAYLPIAPVFWDEYYKVGRLNAGTPIRVILQNPALKLAWILLLTLILIFMVFQSKRRQRIIPVILPYENSTLNYVGTVARLYFKRGDHASLAKKKVLYFKEKIKLRYQIQIETGDKKSAELLSARSGVNLSLVEELYRMLMVAQTSSAYSEKELKSLNHTIELFWQQAKL